MHSRDDLGSRSTLVEYQRSRYLPHVCADISDIATHANKCTVDAHATSILWLKSFFRNVGLYTTCVHSVDYSYKKCQLSAQYAC